MDGGGGGGAVGIEAGGIGGGGGGGGGGGAIGAELGLADGMGGGGGGGGALGASEAGASGAADGGGTVGELTGGGEAAPLSSVADKGRGGPMVPKRIDASWAALVPLGLSSSESSSSSSLSEPQPSSVSARFRDDETGPAAAAAAAGVAGAGAVMRWKGLVETSAAWDPGAVEGAAVGVAVADVAVLADAAMSDCDSIRKYGFRLSVLPSSAAEAAEPACLGSSSWLPTWLPPPSVGVDAWGVICSASSSSDELSSFMFSSCRWSSSDRLRAASISARRAASLASLSLASASAAFFFFFSSSFFTLPCLTLLLQCLEPALGRRQLVFPPRLRVPCRTVLAAVAASRIVPADHLARG